MSSPGLAFAAAAEGFIGAPFRFRGRDPRTGLDCVGLIAASLAEIGRAAPPVPPYSLRQSDFRRQITWAPEAGLRRASGAPVPGDLLLVRAGPAQVHLLVIGRTGELIHAHAGLGKVVATPPPCSWPIECHWRLAPR